MGRGFSLGPGRALLGELPFLPLNPFHGRWTITQDVLGQARCNGRDFITTLQGLLATIKTQGSLDTPGSASDPEVVLPRRPVLDRRAATLDDKTFLITVRDPNITSGAAPTTTRARSDQSRPQRQTTAPPPPRRVDPSCPRRAQGSRPPPHFQSGVPVVSPSGRIVSSAASFVHSSVTRDQPHGT